MFERVLIILFILLVFIFADITVLSEEDYTATSFNFNVSSLFNLSKS